MRAAVSCSASRGAGAPRERAGVSCSKTGRPRAVSGSMPLTVSILSRALYFSLSLGSRTWPRISSPRRRLKRRIWRERDVDVVVALACSRWCAGSRSRRGARRGCPCTRPAGPRGAAAGPGARRDPGSCRGRGRGCGPGAGARPAGHPAAAPDGAGVGRVARRPWDRRHRGPARRWPGRRPSARRQPVRRRLGRGLRGRGRRRFGRGRRRFSRGRGRRRCGRSRRLGRGRRRRGRNEVGRHCRLVCHVFSAHEDRCPRASTAGSRLRRGRAPCSNRCAG